MAKLKLSEDYKKHIPSKETLHRYREYWRLVEWTATPSPSRNPKTHAELAKELGIHAGTIPRWKLASCFYDDVSFALKRTKRDNLANIITAIENMVFKGDGGAAAAAKIWLEWTGEHTPKLKIEHVGAVPQEQVENPLVKAILAKAEQDLRIALATPKHARILPAGPGQDANRAEPKLPDVVTPSRSQEREG